MTDCLACRIGTSYDVPEPRGIIDPYYGETVSPDIRISFQHLLRSYVSKVISAVIPKEDYSRQFSERMSGNLSLCEAISCSGKLTLADECFL